MTVPYISSLAGVIIAAVACVVFLMMNDSGKAEAITQRCPKCGKKTLRKLNKDDPRSRASKWLCAHCGNDEDEFGNKL